eukprot:scaffold17051_cov168-Skeletonema_marinoi.AAC.1
MHRIYYEEDAYSYQSQSQPQLPTSIKNQSMASSFVYSTSMRMIYSLRREEKFMYAELIGNLNGWAASYFTSD